MTEPKNMWQLLNGISQAIGPVTADVVQPMFAELIEEPSTFIILRLAREQGSKPMTAKVYTDLYPYANPTAAQERVQKALDLGLLEPAAGGYVLTDMGCAAVDQLNDAFYARLAEIDALPPQEMESIVEQLHAVIDMCRQADVPRTLGIERSYHAALPRDYAPLALIDLRLDDLNAFRDDAHIAAWQQLGISGRDWEALTFVWRGDAHTGEALAEQLPFRGYSAADYETSLADLEARGWVRASDDGYEVTPDGKEVREAAEARTDEYFYAPWLAQVNKGFAESLEALKSRLQELAPAAEAEGAN